MAFRIIFYNNTAESNRVDKTDYLERQYEFSGEFDENTNLVNPNILIDMSGFNYSSSDDEGNFLDDGFLAVNYCYIPSLARYYFINNMEMLTAAELVRINCRCDTLMTYKEDIYNLTCFIDRQESNYNVWFKDDYLPSEYGMYTTIETIDDYTGDGGFSFLTDNSSEGYTNVTLHVWNNFLNSGGDIEAPGSLPLIFDDISRYLTGSTLSLSTMVMAPDNAMVLLQNTRTTSEFTYLNAVNVWPINIPTAGYPTTDIQFGESIVFDGGSVSWDGVRYSAEYKILASFPLNASSFLDYEPYTITQLWLPYYGWWTLDLNEIFQNTPTSSVAIRVVYYFDYVNADCVVYVCTINKILFMQNISLCVQVGLSSDNTYQVKNNNIANALNIVSGVGMTFAGVATGNPFAIVSGASNAISGITNTFTNYKTATCISSSGSMGLSAPKHVIIKRTKVQTKEYTSDFNHLFGRPLQDTRVLSDLVGTGFTKVGKVHMEGFREATEQEKSDIETRLLGGVIL